MRIFKISFLALAIGSLIFFANCGGGGSDDPSEKEQKTAILVAGSPWTLTAIELPDVNATEEAEWNNFSVSFTATQMTTSGHPAGAGVVWPSSAWTANDNLTQITRTTDGVVMTVQTLNETTLKVSFSMPDNTEIGARTASLGGNYVFTLESAE